MIWTLPLIPYARERSIQEANVQDLRACGCLLLFSYQNFTATSFFTKIVQ